MRKTIPTIGNILKRWVFIGSESVSCPFCSRVLESHVHHFMTCDVVVSARYRIFRWLGWFIVLPRDTLTIYRMFYLLRVLFGLGDLSYDLACYGLINLENLK